MAKLLRTAVRTAKGLVSVLGSFVLPEVVQEDIDEQGRATYPDLVLFFNDDQTISKVVTSFQRSGFIVQELSPKIFGFQCKYEVLLQNVEKHGWKRMTKS